MWISCGNYPHTFSQYFAKNADKYLINFFLYIKQKLVLKACMVTALNCLINSCLCRPVPSGDNLFPAATLIIPTFNKNFLNINLT